ncbi:hypothetical protein BT96DRAFT_59180 [Gymnopus androsaceus JB14]|uniref:Nephrocystin 3-like N-terminal domain-containing protein n=1 Tax=Gymnopus androsaceus JB14 TaxID=1447944 RepID=A0A6A4IE76_9AGAR|nr:hypothetical protein BT96DRAFT_59180 [Gymnopus androsaceus JB14]
MLLILRSMVASLLSSVSSRLKSHLMEQFSSLNVANDEEEKIRGWLNAPNCFINFTSAVDKKAEGTGEWILNHMQYIKWIEETGGILWIQGKAGSGKTVLS